MQLKADGGSNVGLAKGIKHVFLAAAIGALPVLSAAGVRADTPVATADTSCDKLYSFLRTRGGKLPAHWTTNYHNGKIRFAAAAEMEFELMTGFLIGKGRRQMKVHDLYSRSITNADDPIEIHLYPDGKIVLVDVGKPNPGRAFPMYGPYRGKCSNDRFIVFDTGDSVEVIVFEYLPSPY